MLFQDASRRFIDHAEMTHKPGTVRFYKQKICKLMEFFHDRHLEDINRFDIIDFIAEYKKQNPEVSNSTINKHIQTVKVMRNVLTEEPFNVKKLKEEKKLATIIDDKTIKKIFNHYENVDLAVEPVALRNHVMFRLLLDTGLRINELLSLRVQDVLMKRLTIHVKVTKMSMERYVYFSNETAELMKKYGKVFQLREHLFFDVYSGQQLKSAAVQNICQRLENRLKLKYPIRPHKWRHTFATKFLKNGGDLETLRIILGHTNLLTTQRYIHFDNAHIQKEYQRVTNKRPDIVTNYSSPW